MSIIKFESQSKNILDGKICQRTIFIELKIKHKLILNSHNNFYEFVFLVQSKAKVGSQL